MFMFDETKHILSHGLHVKFTTIA